MISLTMSREDWRTGSIPELLLLRMQKFKTQKGASMAVEKELIALRKDYKISQKQISKAIGLSEEQYRRKELGQYDWRATEMFAIRNYLKPFIGPRSLNDIFYDKTTQNVYKAS